MLIKIGGDTLALDGEIRRHIEDEAAKLAARFPGEEIEVQATIQEEFDPLHGHRVRCELSARTANGGQVVVRDARKSAKEAIDGAFSLARRSMRRARHRVEIRRTTVHDALTTEARALTG
jgi:ribosome-associated translation inhibitor RaiA